ncbi:diadenylate cyclase [Sharpea azabuensis]|nr:diadenylate cyclase CdaA [uncultured Sharpea sp.]SFE21605.1 diadenylate cyclase [Sharpea azabuensis]HAJ15800.1 TIGR00159 family protein [Erysipelotrichaceae bacterium]SFL07144.1 diadenylate cyclase [Sharpea azabuensis]HAV18429.1 TIGR00159 family protein [Erysipelotrichaceae bacterium]HBG85690.1 TIGR00159 family protein [Erysipelotrichaceae bacterium]
MNVLSILTLDMRLDTMLQIIRVGVDLIGVFFLIYFLITNFKKSQRTLQVFKGVILILIAKAITSFFGLATLNSLVDAILSWGVLAIIIIFQPEIRSALEKMGATKNEYTHHLSSDERDRIMNELVTGISRMSREHTGALITFERTQDLTEYMKTGVIFEADIKAELLTTIFYEGTPLHDGATIIKNDKIAASACFYPPTRKEVPQSYGARHRAAIGISELNDSLTVVVSEETGRISFCTDGEIREVNPKELRAQLISELDWYGKEGEHHE